MSSRIILGHLIGAGHFAEVYEGLDPIHGPVAIKRLVRGADEAEADWTIRKSEVLKEGKHLSAADHPHVVRVYYATEDDEGTPLLVLEKCVGSLLAEYRKG